MPTEDLVKELDKLYFTDPERYLQRLQHIKNSGYKVLRNAAGKHKVEVNMNQIFGGIFGDIFKGGS